MAKIKENMLKIETKKNRVDISCRKFLREVSGKDDTLEIGKFQISTQLVLNGVDSVNPMMEKIIQKETAKILDQVAKRIEKHLQKLREGIKSKQDEEKKKGNDKAATEADGMVKKTNSLIASEINGLGTTIRKQMKAALKKLGHDPKIETVNRNVLPKIKLLPKAFKSEVSVSYDKKTWSNLGKKIDDIAFASGNKLVEDYIGKANTLGNQIKEFAKGKSKKDEQTQTLEIRTNLLEFKKTVDAFQKKIKQGNELSKATVDMKKQKGKLDKANAGLKKNLGVMEKSRTEMDSELKRFSTMADTALKMIISGKTDRLANLGPMFQSAAKQMSTLSHKMSSVAKDVQKQAKTKTKKA